MSLVSCSLCGGSSVDKIPFEANRNNSRSITLEYINNDLKKKGTNYYYPDTYLCLDCGNVMNVLEKNALEDYVKNKKYFVGTKESD